MPESWQRGFDSAAGFAVWQTCSVREAGRAAVLIAFEFKCGQKAAATKEPQPPATMVSTIKPEI